jgi:hypothetical protein
MRITTVTAMLAVLLLFAGSPAAADGTKVSIAVGAAVPATGIGALTGPTLGVSGWLASPTRGPYEWRAEFGGERLRLPNEFRFRCSAAGFYCDASTRKWAAADCPQ